MTFSPFSARGWPALLALGLLSLGVLSLAACDPPPPTIPCAPGSPGCDHELIECNLDTPCPGGFECRNDGSCEAVCPWGTVGCECDDATCDSGLECTSDNLCQDPSCPLGDSGCACLRDGVCGAGPFGAALTCSSGTCAVVVDDSESPGVPSATCYTPCTQSFTGADGTYRHCTDQGLLEGCIGALECVQGSCVSPGGAPLSCSAAVECPEHQTCISGLCFSNCAVEDDCEEDASCHQNTCRKRCQLAADSLLTCGSGFTCTSEDGQDGVCMPSVTVDEPAPEASAQPFTLSTYNLTLTNNQVSGRFDITNHSGRAEDFVIKKLEHAEVGIDGRLIEREQPLFWLDIGLLGEEEQQPEFEVEILPGETVTVGVAGAFNDTIDRWDGKLRISSSRLGEKDVFLEYSTLPDGEWTGTVHYFINFDDTNIADWLTKVKPDSGASVQAKVAAANATRNAFLKQWTRFRTDPLFKQRQFDALVQATLTGSWSYSSVREACRALFSTTTNAECYLYADGSAGDDGVELYVDTANLRVPTGIMEMPLAVRLQADPSGDSFSYSGRVESPHALQYPGLPPIELVFAADPEDCEGSGDASTCLAPVKSFRSEVLVGGRYLLPEGTSACADDEDTFATWETPWLVPNFFEGTQLNAAGRPVRKECREITFPYDPNTVSYGLEKNRSLAGANPIPDGRVRRRTLELMDGVLVNQKTLLLLVQETFSANLSATEEADFTAYALVQLQRGGSDIEPGGYEPGIVPDELSLPEPDDKLVQACSDELIEEVLGAPIPDGSDLYDELGGSGVSYAEEIASRILNGRAASDAGNEYAGVVHYLCHDTGRIDGAPEWGITEACPIGSRVTYFLYKDGTGDLPLPTTLQTCNGPESNRCFSTTAEASGVFDCPEEQRSSCGAVLSALEAVDTENKLVLELPYVCANEDEVVCSDDRYDLTLDKSFYDPTSASLTAPVSEPLPVAVDNAFRFKTRFKSRSGSTIGFVPAVCASSGNVIPYCYDPAAIESVRARMDCLVDLFADVDEALPIASTIRGDVSDFLEGAFSFYDDFPAPAGDGFADRDGFERLYSELLIMLGDEAMTKAVASRFDLAGSQVGLFEGDKLEPDGIQLSGGAGFEMILLYRSTQYYQLVLDRFYRASPSLWGGLKRTPVDTTWRNFITLNSISTYFNRLILASTKKAQAASEIARRYQAFNRPDLARHVVERTYTEAYLESIALSQFMRRSVAVLDANQRDALVFELDQAQRQYRRALERMRETYQGITDEVTFFGDPPDYVPFPAAGAYDEPPPRRMITRARETLVIAKSREVVALGSNRAFDTDAAQFQAELARVRQQYEGQLADLCGELQATDGNYYPAIRRYAGMNTITSLLGDPCGLLGHGQLYDTVADLQVSALDLRIAIREIEEIIEQVAVEEQRVRDECNGRVEIAEIAFLSTEVLTLQSQMISAQNSIAQWQGKLAVLDRSAQFSTAVGQAGEQLANSFASCALNPPFPALPPNPVACGVGVAAGATAAAATLAGAAVTAASIDKQIQANADTKQKQESVQEQQLAIAQLKQSSDYAAAVAECCLDPDPVDVNNCQEPGPLQVNSASRVDHLMLGLMRAYLEAQVADIELSRAMGRVSSMRNKARRLMAQQEETESFLIDVTAARNDPNVRLYANADVLNADRTYHDALTDAFRATRAVEYYTAQSYAKKGDLLLVRMVGHGENTLEDYLNDLQRHFNDFEQANGRPSQRVALLSLRDDIFRIPRIDESGRALLPEERTALLQERLQDPGLLDDNGYIRVPFSTSLAMTSPLTAVHRVAYVEAEIDGTDLGDRTGRIYLTAKGTGTTRGLDGVQTYHRTAPVTAVINPFFKGVRVFSDAVYQSFRLKDRPLVNTLWELSLNLRDEQVNEDINLSSVTDIRLFFVYEDFSQS